MSYKALGKLKTQMEIDVLKSMTYEEINDIFCSFKERSDLLNDVCDVFSIGEKVRDRPTIMTNINNAMRRSDCLGRVELMLSKEVIVDGETSTEGPLSWGDTPDQTTEKFTPVSRAYFASVKN